MRTVEVSSSASLSDSSAESGLSSDCLPVEEADALFTKILGRVEGVRGGDTVDGASSSCDSDIDSGALYTGMSYCSPSPTLKPSNQGIP